MSETYVVLNRAIVLTQIIVIPLYFLALSNFIPYTNILPPGDLRFLEIILVRGIVPLVLCTPFLLFSYMKRYQLADTYEEMGKHVWSLPTGIKFFYGLNFLFVIAFLLPFLAPIVGLTGGYFIASALFGRSEEQPNIKRPRIRIFTTAYLPIAIFVGIMFYRQILYFFDFLLLIWEENINLLYATALNLADAVVFASIVITALAISEAGAHSDRAKALGNIVVAISFVILESLYIVLHFQQPTGLTPEQSFGFNIIHFLAFLANLVLIILRRLLAIEEEDDRNSAYAWVTILVFQIVNAATEDQIALLSKTTAILLSCVIFMVLFLLSYRKVSSEYYPAQ